MINIQYDIDVIFYLYHNVFFFDKQQKGILIIGANKQSEKDFYKRIIKEAEKLVLKYYPKGVVK